MTSINTFISPSEELIRVSILLNEEDSIVGYQIFTVRPFYMDTNLLNKIIVEEFGRIQKEFNDGNFEGAQNALSFRVNEKVLQLKNEGRVTYNFEHVFITEARAHVTSEGTQSMPPDAIRHTNDGATFFNYGQLPPVGPGAYSH